jgi:putative ABC transport system ATP-binding protein
MSSDRVCIQLSDVQFDWNSQSQKVINIPELKVSCGDTVFIYGPSGSGKSTLLNLMTGVLLPGRGEIRILNQALSPFQQAQRDQFRVDHMGIIFQQFNLLPYLSVLENITLPCLFSHRRRDKASLQSTCIQHEARRLLKALGLDDLDLQRRNITELSTGQQQRVAAARALIGSPEIVIADEPTSALDYDAKQGFLELLFGEVKKAGSTLVFVSHDRSLSGLFGHAIALATINRADIA